jgi:hypothetical protein
MPLRRRLILLVLGLALALAAGGSVAGCSSDDGQRAVGDPVTEDEAQVLAELLHRNFEEGGADFVVSAPYAEGARLTLTGEIDFLRSVGRAQAVTRYDDGRPDETRTLFFTTDQVWFGEVPGLSEALAAAALPPADYVRRPLRTAAGADGTTSLVDVLARVVLNLSARSADDPRAFTDGSYTWRGQQSIDGRLTALYRLKGGQTVAVSASDELLVQYVTPLQGQGFEVTITLADHGPREIDLPADEETVDAGDIPEIAAELGI